MKEDKISIRQFRDLSSNWWVNNTHYNLNALGEITFCAGGISSETDIEALRSFIKRNKKVYQAREKVAEIKDYNALITFGKYINTKVGDVFLKDAPYLKWVRDNYSFKVGEEELKEQIKEVLGK